MVQCLLEISILCQCRTEIVVDVCVIRLDAYRGTVMFDSVDKFATCVQEAPHLSAPTIIKSDVGSHPLPVADDAVDLYALTHNETSTGVMMPIVRPEGATGLVVVDATSGAGGLMVDPT